MKIEALRNDFPIFKQAVRGHRLAYLDSAATSQKPQCVIDSISNFYETSNGNVYRGVHYLSEKATLAFEKARFTVQKFLNASEARECIFVKSTTEAINLVASSFGTFVSQGDEILVSMMEHHANIVPWQMLSKRVGATLKFIPMNTAGELEIHTLDALLSPKTKLVAISHASNALGTLHPIKEIIRQAHNKNIPVLVDGAQSAPHIAIDVQALDCDFFTFSGHKTYGPTGIGVLYGKAKWLENLPPYQGGGEMIKKVSLTQTIYNDIPYKFEAGTPPIAEAIGLSCALEYLMAIGFENIQRHETALLNQAVTALTSLPDLKLIGHSTEKLGILSFNLEGIHPHDIGTIADQKGVAIRTGHHCAMPIMDFYGIAATVRASFGIYNCTQDIEQLVDALLQAKHIFKRTFA